MNYILYAIGFIFGIITGIFNWPINFYKASKYGFQLGAIYQGELSNQEIVYMVKAKLENPNASWEQIEAHMNIDLER